MARASGYRAQLGVIRALLVRDAVSRFGHENLGFFWVVGEPLLLTLGVVVLWTLTSHAHGAVSTVTFVLTGYSMLTMYRHMVVTFVHIMRKNSGILFHSHIKFLDILLARGLLETVACLAAFFVAYLPLSILGIIDPMRDPLVSMGAWFLGAWYSFSFAMIIAGLSETTDMVEHFIQPVLYLSLPFTGTFYLASWVPPRFREVLLYSPFLNAMEMFRSGMMSADIATYWNVWYLVSWCFGQTVMGLYLVQRVQDRIQMNS